MIKQPVLNKRLSCSTKVVASGDGLSSPRGNVLLVVRQWPLDSSSIIDHLGGRGSVQPGDRRRSQPRDRSLALGFRAIFPMTSLGKADLLGSQRLFRVRVRQGPTPGCERRRSPGSDGASPYHRTEPRPTVGRSLALPSDGASPYHRFTLPSDLTFGYYPENS